MLNVEWIPLIIVGIHTKNRWGEFVPLCDKEKTESEVLENLNMEKLNKTEIVAKVSEKIIDYEISSNENKKLIKNLNAQIVSNRDKYNEIEEIKKTIYAQIQESESKLDQKNKLNQINELLDYQDEVREATIWLQNINGYADESKTW